MTTSAPYDPMSISVVIPLFNKTNTVGRALASVYLQTRPADEVVVIDDGSTDGGGEAVKRLRGPRVRLLRQERAGVSAARNRGIEATSGKLIAFLDADDEWRPGFLLAIERLAQAYPTAGACATGYVFVEDRGQRVVEPALSPRVPQQGHLATYFALVTGGAIPLFPSSTAVRRSAFDKVGQFLVGAAWGEDAEMWARIYLGFPIAYLAEPLALYHVSAPNRATNRVDPRPIMPVVKTLERSLREGRICPAEVMDAEHYICNAIAQTIKTNILHGHRALAAQQLKYLRPYPGARRSYWWFRLLTQLPHGFVQLGLTSRNAFRPLVETLK